MNIVNILLVLSVISSASSDWQGRHKRELLAAKNNDSLYVEADKYRDLLFSLRNGAEEKYIYKESFAEDNVLDFVCIDLKQDGGKQAVIVPEDEVAYSIFIFEVIKSNGKPTGVERIWVASEVASPRSDTRFERVRWKGESALKFYSQTDEGNDSSFVLLYDKGDQGYRIVR